MKREKMKVCKCKQHLQNKHSKNKNMKSIHHTAEHKMSSKIPKYLTTVVQATIRALSRNQAVH